MSVQHCEHYIGVVDWSLRCWVDAIDLDQLVGLHTMLVKCLDETLNSLEASALRDTAVNLSEFVVENEAAFAFQGLAFNSWLMADDASVIGSKLSDDLRVVLSLP